jgi:hypothetical protein
LLGGDSHNLRTVVLNPLGRIYRQFFISVSYRQTVHYENAIDGRNIGDLTSKQITVCKPPLSTIP